MMNPRTRQARRPTISNLEHPALQPTHHLVAQATHALVHVGVPQVAVAEQRVQHGDGRVVVEGPGHGAHQPLGRLQGALSVHLQGAWSDIARW